MKYNLLKNKWKDAERQVRLILAVLALTWACVCPGFAQKFAWESEPFTPVGDGFYNILLTPEITGKLNSGLNDIRIYDKNGHEVPYLPGQEEAWQSHRLFREYVIAEKKHTKGCCTELVLQNPAKNRINNISLIIKNAEAYRHAKLSGSSDKQNWYVIKEDYVFEPVYNDRETSEIKVIDFPLSDYEYYKLEIKDSNAAPLNILRAGYYDYLSETGKYTALPSPHITRKDSQQVKSTFLKLSFAAPQLIDRLHFTLGGPVLYKRNVTVAEYVKGKQSYFNTVAYTEFRSHSENTIDLNGRKLKDFYIIIENLDNQPLDVLNVSAFQLNHFLTSYLKAGEEYRLRFQDKEVAAPEYDLGYFRDSIPATVPIIKVGQITCIGQPTVGNAESAPAFAVTNLWVWLAIAAVILLLGYMTVKMTREMNKG